MLRYAKWMLALSLLVLVRSAGAETLSWKFTADGWKPDEWIMLKCPYAEYFSKSWVQKPDCIQNEVPEGTKPEEWQGKRANECYTSMVFAKQFSGDARITSTMDFTPEMAPLIVVAADVRKDDKGRSECHDYWEICVFNKGVNVWHHVGKEFKPPYKKAAYAKFELKPGTKYTLDVEIKGKQMVVRIDGQEFGYIDDALPAQYYVGITGCEGLNSFYDMSVTTKGTPAK